MESLAGMASIDDVNFELPKLRTSLSLEVKHQPSMLASFIANTTPDYCRTTPGSLAVMIILQASIQFYWQG